MTLIEALEACKSHKDVVARRPCWDSDSLKNTESIFWNEREGAFCYYYFIDKSRLVELPRGWGDSPEIGVAVGAIGLTDAIADDWVVVDILSREPVRPEFEDNDHFAGSFWDLDPPFSFNSLRG